MWLSEAEAEAEAEEKERGAAIHPESANPKLAALAVRII